MKMLRLPRSKVLLGSPLPWNVRDEQGLLMLSRGHVIESEHQLELLLQRGAFVDPNEVREIARNAESAQHEAIVSPLNIFGLWDQTTDTLHKLMASGPNQPDFSGHMDHFARHILELVDLNPDIAIYRSVRQDNAKNYYYGYAHSVHTAMLCILMARHLTWSESRMLSLVKAALSMNMTILELQGQMAGHADPIKDKQREAIHMHPAQCSELLEKAGITDDDWLDAVAQHHERSGGGGYPLGRTDPCEMAIALRTADVFMARISPRALRPAMAIQDAVRELHREDKGGPVSTAIIKVLGIYPPGDFVKLASGELGLVVQRTSMLRAPIVSVITDTAGHPVARTIRRDSGSDGYAIVANMTDKTMLMRLPPERLYGFSAAPHT